MWCHHFVCTETDHVTSGHVTSCHVTSGHVTSGHMTSCHVTSGHVTPGGNKTGNQFAASWGTYLTTYPSIIMQLDD